MTRPTPESLHSLRRSLRPLGEGAPTSPEMREFCEYYGIDFERRLEGVEHRFGTVVSGEYTLVAHYYIHEGARSNLLLVHGYLDHAGLFSHLIEYGLQQRANVLVFDLPGHGLSSGEPAAIDDFREYSRAIGSVLDQAGLPPLPRWVMAQSTGCAALMEYSRTVNWPFVAAVFLAPLLRPKGWGMIRLAHMLLHRFISGTRREFSRNSSDPEFLAFVRQDPLQSRVISVRWVGALRRWLADLPMRDLGMGPVLIVQGKLDETVAWQRNMRDIPALLPACRIEYLEGAGHHLANESAAIRGRYLALVGEFLGEWLQA